MSDTKHDTGGMRPVVEMPDGHNPDIATVASASPNDAARRQTANKNPYRYCVPQGGEKGEY